MRGRRDFQWRHVGVVFRKELIDTTRDRRTWLAMIIIPLLLVPLLLLAMPTIMVQHMERVEETPVAVAVVGAEHYPDLVAFLDGLDGVNAVQLEDPVAGLAERAVHAILYLPEGMAAAVAGEVPAQLRLAFDASDEFSTAARDRLAAALGEFASRVVAGRLAARGLDPAILNPLPWSVENLAPPQRMVGFALGMIMPMLLAIWASTGGMYAAIDGAAGEKERGTLEPLLSTPASRTAIVIGKYLAVVLTSVLASAVSLLGMVLTFLVRPAALLGPGADLQVGLAEILPAPAAGVILLVVLGLAGMFSALQLAISLYARSFREAQTYLSPLSFVVIFPAIFTQFLPVEHVPEWFFFVPVLGSLAVLKEALVGIIDLEHIAMTLAVSAVGIRFALAFAVACFRKERVLFRT
ncbi:MAG TPA: ABC transporter permease [Bacillota bacterium]|nr:ABC transporter permease [Bacillota bacterium]